MEAKFFQPQSISLKPHGTALLGVRALNAPWTTIPFSDLLDRVTFTETFCCKISILHLLKMVNISVISAQPRISAPSQGLKNLISAQGG